MTMPNPIPATASVQPTVDRPAWGEMSASVNKMPPPARTHPVIMGTRGPRADTQRPVNTEARTIPAVMGMKSRAREKGDTAPTSSRYRATKKKMEKMPK